MQLKKTWIFRKLSSVQLAVPTMLIIAAVVAYGTILESRYNADYARLIVYDAWWFQGMLVLLGTNILFAALSRIPYKLHHIGFVTTHLGMITLLIGSAVTKYSGLDGSLTIAETTTGRSVALDNRVLEIVSDSTFKKIQMPRSTTPLRAFTLEKLNEQMPYGYKLKRFAPFVRPNNTSFNQGVTVQFKMQSQFFNQSVSLNSIAQPEMQMGPATLRILPISALKNAAPATEPAKKARDPQNELSSVEQITITDAKSGAVLKKISLADFKKGPVNIQGVAIHLENAYSRATVSNNKISDGGGTLNPALEINAKKDGNSLREVLYAKYPGFSLNKDGVFGLRLAYEASTTESTSAPAPEKIETHSSAPTANAPTSRPGNVIELYYSEGKTDALTIKLFKNDKPVMSKVISQGEVLETPWMGMKITLESITAGGEGDSELSTEITEIVPQLKEPQLPPSALQISALRDGKEFSFWLSEGQVQKINIGTETAEIYYGRDFISLPFSIELQKFYKKNYPGTETAISFESHVRVNGAGEPIIVSMNEPLKSNGYTLYQSSYDMQPGQPVYSIFSVNKDPGRPIKYAGSIILALGIIIFTYMRSRLYKPN